MAQKLRTIDVIMTHERQLRLAEHKLGRIWLHMMAMARDHNVLWHLRGVLSEVRVL